MTFRTIIFFSVILFVNSEFGDFFGSFSGVVPKPGAIPAPPPPPKADVFKDINQFTTELFKDPSNVASTFNSADFTKTLFESQNVKDIFNSETFTDGLFKDAKFTDDLFKNTNFTDALFNNADATKGLFNNAKFIQELGEKNKDLFNNPLFKAKLYENLQFSEELLKKADFTEAIFKNAVNAVDILKNTQNLFLTKTQIPVDFLGKFAKLNDKLKSNDFLKLLTDPTSTTAGQKQEKISGFLEKYIGDFGIQEISEGKFFGQNCNLEKISQLDCKKVNNKCTTSESRIDANCCPACQESITEPVKKCFEETKCDVSKLEDCDGKSLIKTFGMTQFNDATCCPSCFPKPNFKPLEGNPFISKDFKDISRSKCSSSQIAQCLDRSNVCAIGEVPFPMSASCCPSCISPIFSCSPESSLQCYKKARQCDTDEVPVTVKGSCCLSCYVRIAKTLQCQGNATDISLPDTVARFEGIFLNFTKGCGKNRVCMPTYNRKNVACRAPQSIIKFVLRNSTKKLPLCEDIPALLEIITQRFCLSPAASNGCPANFKDDMAGLIVATCTSKISKTSSDDFVEDQSISVVISKDPTAITSRRRASGPSTEELILAALSDPYNSLGYTVASASQESSNNDSGSSNTLAIAIGAGVGGGIVLIIIIIALLQKKKHVLPNASASGDNFTYAEKKF